MCAGGLSLGVLGAIGGIGQSLSQSNAAYQQEMTRWQYEQVENEIQQRRAEDEARNKRAAAILNYQQLDTAQQEANEVAANDAFQVRREMARAKALTAVSAAGANISGNTVDRLSRMVDVEQTFAMNDIENSRVSQVMQLQSQKLGMEMEAQVNPIYQAIANKPKRFTWQTAMNAALGGLGGYMQLGGYTSTFGNTRQSETASWSVSNPNISGTTQRNYVPLLGVVRS